MASSLAGPSAARNEQPQRQYRRGSPDGVGGSQRGARAQAAARDARGFQRALLEGSRGCCTHQCRPLVWGGPSLLLAAVGGQRASKTCVWLRPLLQPIKAIQ